LRIRNKVDLGTGSQSDDKMVYLLSLFNTEHHIQTAALNGLGVRSVLEWIIRHLPEHPPYYPKDELTDKPERFFAAEIIREKIFLHYQQEIPYSTQVEVTEFREDDDIIRMRAEIYVERSSQKGIIIGKKGESIKQVGIDSRMDMEKFFQKKVHLETFVKVAKDWRKNDLSLKRFGYRPS
jgi:GTP-binding protein Era